MRHPVFLGLREDKRAEDVVLEKRSPARGSANVGRTLLIILGIVLVVLGMLWPLITRLGLGRLPGDIVIERENFRLYIPIMTSVIVSIVLSVILWLINR